MLTKSARWTRAQSSSCLGGMGLMGGGMPSCGSSMSGCMGMGGGGMMMPYSGFGFPSMGYPVQSAGYPMSYGGGGQSGFIPSVQRVQYQPPASSGYTTG
ncbi:unnamed protein product [Anisakis simplex]|uniref:Uncharacterized protein n=1 Tax=Anisakis simplex TaxID=6269 RepID=A0A0M3KF84_ANISI|nr:unnamed protein product [Anisakis simplex]